MKQFLHAIPLRRFVLVAAIGLFAAPAAHADSLACPYDADFYPTLDAGETDPDLTDFVVARSSTTTGVYLRAESSDPATVSISPASTRLAVGKDEATFKLSPKKPSANTVTITVYIQGDADPAAKAEFPVKVIGTDTTRSILIGETVIELAENSTKNVSLTLGSPAPDGGVTLNVTGSTTETANHVSFPSTVFIAQNATVGNLRLRGLDGDFDFSLTLSDQAGNFDDAVLQGSVTNLPPTILASTDPQNPTPWGQRLVKNQNATFTWNDIGGSDVSADMDKLSYRWSFASASTTDKTRVFTNAWTSASAEGSPYIVWVEVSDGDASVRGYFAVSVEESVTLYTDTTAPWAGLQKQGGIAESSTFSISNPAGVDWDPDGSTEVAPGASVRLSAVLEAGSYPFGWFGSEEHLRAPGAMRVPNPNLTSYVTMPTDGDATVFYYASYPYYHTVPGKGAVNGLNPVLTDPFGDFDADGLSDTWEDYYFPVDEPKTSENLEALPVGIPTGDYGPVGNLDDDWLPTSLFEPAPDGARKIGWPAVTIDETTGAEVTNRYKVYKYPLDFSTGGESYNKSAYDEKPLFGNFVEYRGLAENRTGDDGEDPKMFVYYAPEFVANDGARGNCSGTDPENYDTDGDGFSDGWEWYFWTTIKYRVNTQNWRAWDPTYSLYSTDSKSAGIPLLRTDDPDSFTFSIQPTESYVIDPAAGTHMTTYEVDKDVVDANHLVMPVKAGSVKIVFDNADGFTLWTIPGRMTTDGKDALFYQQWGDLDYDGVPETPATDDEGNPLPVQLDGAWVDDATGYMHVPGWTVLTALADTGAAADIDQDTTATVSYDRLNGIFTQQHLLSRFDPMNWTETDMGNIKDYIDALGYDKNKWDPDSDLDGDGVLDVEEYYLGTDPLHWDTDRDGMPDGWEVQRGLLPRDPRNGVNGCGPGDNPDEDYMAVSTGVLGEAYPGTWTHIYSYLADLYNRRYWNGLSYVGFVPGKAATSGTGFSNREEFLVSLYGFQTAFWWDAWRLPLGYEPRYTDDAGVSKYAKGIYPVDWPQTTSNPCDNDTNRDGIPDGWSLYIGYNPIDGVCVTPLGYPPEDDPDGDQLKLRQEFSSVTAAERWPEDKVVYIGADATITENTSTTVDADGNTNTVYSTTGNGTPVYVRAMPHVYPAWSNKKLTTDPWNADTDGDGLTDYQEYTDEMDGNGDGIELTNFNPGTADTDLDWLPDGWEFLMGTYTTNQTPGISTTDPYGPYGDPDGDGLPNYQEYLTGANYAWRHDKWYSLDNQKIWIPQRRPLPDPDDKYDINMGDWPYDPGLYPEFGPVVKAHQYRPMDFFAVPESPDWINDGILALRAIEKRWGVTTAESPSIEYETVAAFFQRLTEIVMNPFDDPSGMGKSKFMFDTQPSVDPDYNTDRKDVPGKKYFRFHTPEEHWAIVHAYEGILGHLYSYAQCPYPWDTAALNNTPSGVPWTYIPLNDNSTGSGFPGTRPKQLDSDHDNMSDYWEIYHGLNPIYGGCIAISDKAGSELGGDWDGADNWMMGNDPNFVLNLHLIPPLEPISRGAHVWYDEDKRPHTFGDGEDTAFAGVLERAHYDLVNRPWLAGDPSADCDHDGLNNQEESYSVFANDRLHNTDPSPYWLTDITQTYEAFGQKASHVNLYYTSLGFGDDPADYWWWEYPYTGNDGCNAPPTYLWDFEINEGYDTDNNNVSDREELTDTSTRGKTDPQDLDSPVSRKAMYFDGHAACRTQRPFFHDQYALTSFTVEFWVRPQELPAPGRIATLVQRPVMMPVDTISGAKAWDVRHTFLIYLNDKGEVCAEVDNDAIEQPANRAVVTSAGRLVPNVWTHVALVMDSRDDLLTLYLDGEQPAQIATSLKPCTGVIMDSSYQNWVTDDGGASGIQTVSTTTVNFQYSPAPIVLGAYDTTPWSVIGLNPDAVFDENRFFKGWIDEVRIWDRCRTQSEIVNNRSKRFTKRDVEAVNQPRFVWDMEHLYQTNAEGDFPQKLLYLFNFDNLPDVVPAPTRVDGLVFASDTDPVPAGWPQISATRPIPYVPWWYVTANRSTVYSADYAYVPFIENVVSHMPQRPPRGIKELVPVFDTEWNLAGYRYRLSADWSEELDSDIMAGETVIGDVAYQYEENGGQALIAPSRLTNTMDPYGDVYSTGVASDYELSPWNFAGILDPYGVYEGVPIHSDMVPLLDAVADMDVPMWDGKGAGWDNAAIDSDGDGLPDWWEIVHGLDPNDATGVNGAYGDGDHDGLDNWAEYLSGTDPHSADTNSDGYTDYFSRADGQSLTYGELYDDGDGMDNAWELANGLDPDGYDAHLDLDHDGWTNWEEYMAGTDPQNASSFPNPDLRVTFHYDGVATNTATIGVYTYGERISGNTMGGSCDGKYTIAPNLRYGALRLGQDGVAKIAGFDRAVTLFPQGHVAEATITYMSVGDDGTETETTVDLDHSNEEYGMFVNDMEGSIGLEYESGTVFATGDYVGRLFQLDVTIDGHSFPFTEDRMLRTANTHVVGGWNRFFGFIDTNSSGEFEVGEPAGLSIPRPVQVGWDKADAEIPLTDELYAFPRFSWTASTNENVNAYKVYVWNGNGGSALVKEDGTFVNGIVVKAPRTFIHEGDFIRHGVYGIRGGSATTDTFSWTVASDNGIAEEVVAEGSFVMSAVPNYGSRRAMKVRSPVSGATVNGAVVELQWEMDWRNAGVFITVRKLDGADAGVKINNLCVPLPVRHGKVDSEGYYFSAKPQLENGKSFVPLTSGSYEYTITERPNTTAVTAKSITGKFNLVNDDSGRGTYSINGTVKYFGKLMESAALVSLGTAPAGSESFTATIPAAKLSSVVPGAMSVQFMKGSDVVCFFSDIGGRGTLSVDGADVSDGWSGSINYETGEVFIRLAGPLANSCTVSLMKRSFPSEVPLYVRAYQVPDTATTAVSLSGPCAAQTRLSSKGPFSVTGLRRGTYTVHAFLDVNGNGVADEWETQGFGVLSGRDSPILDARAAPLVVDNELQGVTIVLHDRDTDNDRLPDAWEYWKFGNLATSGNDQKTVGVYVWEEYADGVLDSDPRTPDTDLDGLTDAMEIKVTGTDSHKRDTDGDGIGDLEEFLSGSDPLDPTDARPFSTPALAFDADGVPYVECAHPALVPGVVLTYTLQRKLDLAAPAWEDVAELEVAATDSTPVALADGVMGVVLPAGKSVMKPADQAGAIDYKAGFFRIRVSADYGKMVDNGDGTCSYLTWMPAENGTWSWAEAARGTGTLVRDADGTWSFVSDATGREAALVRDENGNWTFQE